MLIHVTHAPPIVLFIFQSIFHVRKKDYLTFDFHWHEDFLSWISFSRFLFFFFFFHFSFFFIGFSIYLIFLVSCVFIEDYMHCDLCGNTCLGTWNFILLWNNYGIKLFYWDKMTAEVLKSILPSIDKQYIKFPLFNMFLWVVLDGALCTCYAKWPINEILYIGQVLLNASLSS